MSSDKEIALRSLDMQARARDYSLVEIPLYMNWAERKLAEGESAALIAHLDATSMWLLPEELQALDESDFEELLADLKDECGE